MVAVDDVRRNLGSLSRIVRILSSLDLRDMDFVGTIGLEESRRWRVPARGFTAEPRSRSSSVTSVKHRFFRAGMRLGMDIVGGAGANGTLDFWPNIPRSLPLMDDEGPSRSSR